MEYDSGSLKSEHGSSRWRREKNDDAPKSDMKKPVSLGQPLRRGKNPPIGVTSPITQTGHTVSKEGSYCPCFHKSRSLVIYQLNTKLQ